MFCLECVHCALTHAFRDNGVLNINLWLVFLVILGGLKDHLKEIKRCKRLMMIGCGTSFHAAVAVSQRYMLVLKCS